LSAFHYFQLQWSSTPARPGFIYANSNHSCPWFGKKTEIRLAAAPWDDGRIGFDLTGGFIMGNFPYDDCRQG
jgi:hypothetical protein